MFTRTTAINKVLALDKFVRGVQGGTSAGKTYAIIPVLIDKAAKQERLDISVVSESIPHLKRGAMKDFKDIMLETGRWVDSRWNASDFKYTFANRSVIEFFSATDDTKLRGARRHWLYMNECNNLTLHAYNELVSRTKNGVYLDWNPTAPFWFHEDLMNDSDVDYITLTYLDNEACPESAKNFILKAKEKAATSAFWDNWYKVYGLGQIGSLQGTVFENWDIVQSIPSDAEFICYGLDFGFSNDPTAMVGIYRYNSELYVEELIYDKRLTNSDIISRFKELGIIEYRSIVADSAEPKSIEDLSRAGYNVESAMKGPDSIRASIDTIQQFKFHVTQGSTNLIKELRGYKWLTDKSGKSLNEPIDSMNHAIDAFRYGCLNKIGRDSIFEVY